MNVRGHLLLTVLLTGCQHIEPASVAAEAVFASGAVQHPKSAAALLTNLQRALAEPLLLSNELYEDEVLRSFFGGSIVETLGRSPPSHFVLVRGLDYLPARERDRTQVSIRKVPATGTEPQIAILALSCWCELQLSDVEAEFGARDRVIAEDRRPSIGHLPAPPPPSNALGNDQAGDR